MADGRIEYDIVANTSKLKSDISGIGSVAAGVGKTILGIGAAVGSAAIAVGSYAVKVGSDFEAAMSNVVAIAGFSVAELNTVGSEAALAFEALEAAALEAGRTTVFTATQSAEALGYLQLAGYSVEDSIAALPSVLNLAAAANIDLGYATNLVVDSAHALGIELDDLDGFLDQITATAFNSNTNIEDLGEAFLVLGGTGRLAAGGTEELNQVLGILADNGIKGSEAGTKLRNVFLSLTAPTDKARDQLEALGVVVEDAEGNLRPLEEIVGDLGESINDLGDVEASAILNNIFNKRDLVAVQALLNATEEDWTKLSDAIQDSAGATAQAAETLLDNLQGDLTLLRSQLEYTGIAIYQQFQDPLREAVQTASEFLDTITSDGTIEQFGEVIGDLGVAIVEGLVSVLPVLLDLIQELLPVVQQAAEDIFPVLVDAIFDLVPVIADLISGLLPPLIELFTSLLPPIIELIDAILPPLIELIDALLPIVIQIIDDILPFLIDLLNTLLPPILELITTLLPPLLDLWNALSPILDVILDLLAILIDLFMALLGPILDVIVEALGPLITIVAEVVTILATALIPILEVVMDVFGSVFNFIDELVSDVIGNILRVLGGLIDFIVGVFTGDWERAWQGVQDIFGGLFDGLVTLIKAPLNLIIEIINAVIRGLNQIQLPDWVPGIGGKGLNLPEIPKLAVGMDYVPSDDFPALLHEGEAVLTAKEAAIWRALKNSKGGPNASLSDISSARQSVQPDAGTTEALNRLLINVDKLAHAMRSGDRKLILEVSGDSAELVRWLNPQLKEEDRRVGAPI